MSLGEYVSGKTITPSVFLVALDVKRLLVHFYQSSGSETMLLSSSALALFPYNVSRFNLHTRFMA